MRFRLQELVKTKEVDEDIQYLLTKNEEMVDQINAIESKIENRESNGEVNVNFSGLAESVLLEFLVGLVEMV